MPPMSCTSKWRMFSVRLAASRTTANASGSRSSSVSPFSRRSRNSSVLARSCASDNATICGSSALICSTTREYRFSSRSLGSPNIFLTSPSMKRTPLSRALTHHFILAIWEGRGKVEEVYIGTSSFIRKKTAASVMGGAVRPASMRRLDQPVPAVGAAVHHVDLVRVRILEHEEVVPEQVHLQDGFLHVHRLQFEPLDPHQFVFVLIRRLGTVRGAGRGNFFPERAFLHAGLAELAVDFRFVLADLPFQLVDHQVDGSVHVIASLFRPQ